MKSNENTLSKKPQLYQNPYNFFYDTYKELNDEPEFDPDDFDYSGVVFNYEKIQEHIDNQLNLIKIRCEEDPKYSWVYQAAQQDPAFMVDPVRDYYMKIIPEQLKKVLTDDQLMELISIYDPVTWGERNLLQSRHNKWKPRISRDGIGYQAQMIRCRSRFIVARAGRRCLNDNTIVQTLNGPLTAAELYYTDDKPAILTMDESTNNIYPTTNYEISGNGYDETYRLTTRSGHIDTMTQDHPYYTIRNGMPEWVDIKDLKPGDRIAVLKKFPILSKCSLGRDMSRLMGYLTADGGTTVKTCSARFTNINPSIVQDLSDVCMALGYKLTEEKNRKHHYTITGLVKYKNNIRKVLEENDMRKLAIHKSVPTAVFLSTEDDIVNFISAAWDCDGWVSIQNNTASKFHPVPGFEVGYGSSSHSLIYGMKHLLLMIGIVSTVKKRKVKYNGEYRDSFQLTIHDRENFLKFYNKINLIAKQSNLDKIKSLLDSKKDHSGKSYMTQTPTGIVNEIENLRRLKNVDKHLMCSSPNERYRTDGRLYSIEKAKKYAAKLNAYEILRLIDNDDFWWDEVSEVKHLGSRHSYAITVPETETFIANDTVTHNTGKSASLIVRVLHRAFTFIGNESSSTFNIIFFTPNQSQISLLFKMIEVFIDKNPKLLSMLKKDCIPTRKTPFWQLEFNNGVTIKGFVSGSTAIRGQAADMLILDEASYLDDTDIDAVVSLMAENKNVEVWVSSTPKGLKDWFYERTHDPMYVSFHFPSDKFHPYWDEQMEDVFRKNLTTNAAYAHEILAEFSEDGEGVFPLRFIEKSKSDHKTGYSAKHGACYYGMGIDWNSITNGTQIKVVEFNLDDAMYSVVDSASIAIENQTQITSVNKAVELCSKWDCAFIYADMGYGATQIELMHQIGKSMGKKGRVLMEAKGIDFASTIEIRDPVDGRKIKKPTKPFMVNNAVKIFESERIKIPIDQTMLIKQLEGYTIARITPSGYPVYAANPKVGDHELDALMLALLGFTMELSSLGKPIHTTNIRHIPRNGNNLTPYEAEAMAIGREIATKLAMDKAREAEESSLRNNSKPFAYTRGERTRRSFNTIRGR